MEPGARLFLNDDHSEGLFGDGKYLLLKAIEEHGSLRKAAGALGRGYRKAWEDIRRTEEGFGRPIVEMTRGGSDGGSARLTDFGRALLEAWERYRDDVNSEVESAWARYLKELIEGGDDGKG